LGIVIRQSLWNTLVAYAGVVLGAINVIWLFPTVLGDTQFGVTRLLLSASLIAAQVAQLGMGNVTFRFFPSFQDAASGHRGFLKILLMVPFIGFVLYLALFFGFREPFASLFAQNAPLFVEYDLFLIPLVGFTLYFNVFDAWLRSVYRTVSGSFLRDVVLRLLQMLSIGLYWLELIDFHGFIVAFAGVHGIVLLLIVLWTFYTGELKLSHPYAPPTNSLNREMKVYAGYAILGGISAIAIANLDLLMVGAFLGEANAGYYAIAFFIGTFISIPERSISKISYPIIAQAFQKDDKALVASMYAKTSLNQVIIGLLIFIGIWANVHNAVELLPDGFFVAKNVMIIISAAKLIDMATGANSIILLNSPWYKFDLVLNVMLVMLTIVTNLLLIPIMGIDGAAWASFITIFVYNATKFVYIKMKLGMQPFRPAIVKVLVAGMVAYGVSAMIPHLSIITVDLLLRSAAITAVYGAIIVFWRASEDVENIRKSILRKFGSLGF
jgi:O-antigen/teichoic acid export membrane protein